MVARTKAVHPTPWSQNLAEPKIDHTAYVHSFSNLIGDVQVCANVLIAPGTSIRADEGTPFSIGESTNIQDGVIIHGLATGRVLGDNDHEYSVWIGKNTCIAHMALIHGPAYIGDNCFIGFRSTVFNARVGHGSIVMMHALIQDVEIPPGKFVPSGAVITNQQQADCLSNVQESDQQFALHMVTINQALNAGYGSSEKAVSINALQKETANSSNGNNHNHEYKDQDMSLQGELLNQIRPLISQGYKLRTEYADKRRFKTSSWLTGETISSQRLEIVKAELEACLSQHQGEYVRLIVIDQNGKQRVSENIIQRPDDKPVSISSTNNNRQKAPTVKSNSGLNNDLSQQVRSLLHQGYQISTEYADKRRFKTGSWLTGGIIHSQNEREVLSNLDAVLADHEGEYVRLIGIDTQAKKRVLETIIQKPGENNSTSNPTNNGTSTYYKNYSNGNSTVNSTSSGLSKDIIDQVRSLIAQGCKIGTEHADKRRFRTSSWLTCSPIASNQLGEIINALEGCLQEHQGEYVRLIGIDPKQKRRLVETIIQKPEGNNGNGHTPTATVSTPSYNSNVSTESTSQVGGSLSAEIVEQVRSLLARGYKIGSEHADKRRFKTGSWLTCPSIDSNRERDAIAGLEACLREHQGEYVRLIGIDTQAKRRVVETIINRP